MSETNPVVIEISSDEEVSSDDANVRDDEDTKLMKFDDDDDDDDCVVLDCDPEKVVNENERVGDGDDVFVVGQKGQIACRDYPHPRHDCAKFPFISTPHETHCDLCHCYVCDSRAPCASWSKGRSSDDHCHANDKNERWKTQREKLRLQKNGTIPDTLPSSSVVASQISQMTLTERGSRDSVQSKIRLPLQGRGN